jgi:hypothetical protein
LTGSGSESRPHDSPVEALTSELAQLREQQVATNEVLLAVARSDFELQPIFETVVEQAIRRLSRKETTFGWPVPRAAPRNTGR